MIRKAIFTLIFVLLALFTLTAQERTTYRGDTSLYASIRTKIALVSDSIKKTPNDKKLFFSRASLLFDIERWNDAEADLTKAIELDSTAYQFYYKRGAVRERLNKASDAYVDFTETIRFNPSYEWAYLDRGIVLSKLNLYKEADKDFRAALTLKPNWGNAFFNLGSNYDDLGSPDSALHYYKQAVLYDNNLYKAYNNIGSIYNKQKKYDEAIEQFNKALTIWDKYTFALTNRAEAKYRKGDKAGACNDLKRAIDLGRTDKLQVYNQLCQQ